MEERDYLVYKHTSPSNKVYIGITSRKPEERWKNGKGYPHNKYFTSAIEKYGWDNFKHEILFTNLTKEEACQKEIELISFYKSNQSKFGYNNTSGGEYFHHNNCTKELISKSLSGKKKPPRSEEHCKHLSEGHKGQTGWNKGTQMPEEFCKKISEANKGRETWNKGKKGVQCHSEETRKNISKNSATPKVAIAYKEYKAAGGLLKWNEFQKEYTN